MTKETFASFVHRRLVGNRDWPIKVVADAMGMSAEMLYARLYGRTPLNADELRDFFSVVHDVEIANRLLDLSPFIAVTRSELMSSPAESLQRGAVAAMLEATDIVRSTQQALLDGRLDHREKSKIGQQILETEQAVASLKQLLESMG